MLVDYINLVVITLVLLRKGFPLGENKGKGVGFPKNNILPGYPTFFGR